MATKGDISDLDVLVFGKQPLIPLVSGFSRNRRSGVVQSSAAGGATRQRKKFYGTVYEARAKFYLETPAQQAFIKQFFERNEGKRFICHLAADRPVVEPYVVQVISEWNDSYVSAVDGELSVTLEIFSVRTDPCLDDFLYEMYQCLGDDVYCVLKGITEVVEELP